MNYSKSRIEQSFAKPVYLSGRDEFVALLRRLRRTPDGRYPGLHMTHAEYDRKPEFFGDAGERAAFHFFLDIDGRPFLEPAGRVADAMARALEDLDVPHYVKFSGSCGFHIHVPSHAFPDRIDGRPFVSAAPELFLDLKHYMVRRAGRVCPRAILETVIHPRQYHVTTQGIQRLPLSLHETTGFLSIPLRDEEIQAFSLDALPRLSSDLGSRMDIVTECAGSADSLLSLLEEERSRPVPFHHRR